MIIGEVPQIKGPAIIHELRRQINLPPEQRPLMGVHTNNTDNPEYTGGIRYIPMVLEGLASNLTPDGQVISVLASFNMIENGKPVMQMGASYDTTDTTEPPTKKRIRELTIYPSF